MSSSSTDFKVAALAAGFTLGFGFLTVWEAIKQTRRNRNPARSIYIYMIWGEIAANVAIGIIAWLLVDGVIQPTPVSLFFILFCWVFEIQLLMQIIINRIAIIAENRQTIRNLKWGTALVITLINIAVFCIFIPAHTIPPASQTFVEINKYWDRISKILILIVDAGLNWYFLRIVKRQLLSRHGLMKYKPLVRFNAGLMLLSIAMDAVLIGLMSYPNQLVFTQFHPVTYMVKLNIEMSMASLIAHLAGIKSNAGFGSDPHSHPTMQSGTHRATVNNTERAGSMELTTYNDDELAKIQAGASGIHKRFDVEVRFDTAKSAPSTEGRRSPDEGGGARYYSGDDEVSLTNKASPQPRSIPGN